MHVNKNNDKDESSSMKHFVRLKYLPIIYNINDTNIIIISFILKFSAQR